MSAIAAAGIAGAASIAGSTFSGIGAGKRQKRQNDFQREMLYEQNRLNVENWEKQNAYNSDTAQVSRRRAAGLNPVTIDGGSNAGTMAAATAPSVGSPAPVPNYASSVADAISAYRASTESDVLKSQANKNNAEADALRGKTDPSQTDMLLKRTQSELNKASTSLARSKGVSETLSQSIMRVDRQLRNVTLGLAKNQLSADSAQVGFSTPDGRKVSLPAFLARNIVLGAQITSQLEDSVAARSRRYSAASRAAIDAQEASNWSTSFKASLDEIAAKIRSSLSTAEMTEFENSVNKAIKHELMFRKRNENNYYGQSYKNKFAVEDIGFFGEGGAYVGKIISTLSPFKPR